MDLVQVEVKDIIADSECCVSFIVFFFLFFCFLTPFDVLFVVG